VKLHVCRRCRRVHPPQALCPDCLRPLKAQPPEYLVGEVIGKNRLERVLGTGATGVVYLAAPDGSDRRVALKLLIPDETDDAVVRRFLREARLLAELRNPHVVEIYECASSEWGVPYFTMELLEGVSLRRRLAERPEGLPFDEVCRHAREIADGLIFTHRRGVIHRDLKPEHVIETTTPSGPLDKILDFGFAKSLVRGGDTRITSLGLVLGTPSYLSPEQVRDRPLGPWTDQYAFALVVAELLTGRKVRGGMSLADIVTTEIARPIPAERFEGRDLPPQVARVLARATDPDPRERFPDVRAFVRALEGDARAERRGLWYFLGRLRRSAG